MLRFIHAYRFGLAATLIVLADLAGLFPQYLQRQPSSLRAIVFSAMAVGVGLIWNLSIRFMRHFKNKKQT